MIELNKNKKNILIEEELKKSYLDYAMSVIIGRALPDVRDGLKPVHRRILFAMYILKNYFNKNYKKSARIVGDVIGKYHPHGDSAVYDAIVRMAQDFSLRYKLIDGQGNFGSIDGDSAAAMRYTEIRMSKISHELILDIEKNTVDYYLNYDGTHNIPNILPAKIPNLLINGSSGIAVGMATNIPSHNISEIIDGCLAYIKNKNITLECLMKYIPGPDFPTYAIIKGTKGIKEAYKTGYGKIYIKARAKIKKYGKNGRECIIINEIPYQVNKSKLIKQISNLTKDKKIEGINNIRDESDKDGMRIVIEIKKYFISSIILNKLFLNSKLQISFGINMVALCNGQPKLLSLKEIIYHFIKHRKEIIIRRTIFKLKKLKDRSNILEGLYIAINNIDYIINLILKSKTPKKAKIILLSKSWNFNKEFILFKNFKTNNIEKKLKEKKTKNTNNIYYLNNIQAKAILNIKLQNITHIEINNIKKEYIINLNKIKKFKNILKNNNELIKIIKSELIEIKEKYQDKRKTEIINNDKYYDKKNILISNNVIIIITYNGYIKYQKISEFESQHRGGKGKSIFKIQEEDFIKIIQIANTNDIILFFSNFGKVYFSKIEQIKKYNSKNKGINILSMLSLSNKEKITCIFPIKKYIKKYYIILVTEKGMVKKNLLINFLKTRKKGIRIIKLKKNDNIVDVNITNSNNDIMLFSSYGKVLKFNEKQIRSMNRNSLGIKGIKMIEGDTLTSIVVQKEIKSTILTITRNGYGKRTYISEYPSKSRSKCGIISINLKKRNIRVIGSIEVKDSDKICIITNKGKLVIINVSEISIVKRNTQGVILINTEKNEQVIGIKKLPKDLNKN
ncbi:MAG: DNA topoisomerase (ATP-hydrolyzing) subunit A [Enterobacterales bacterium]